MKHHLSVLAALVGLCLTAPVLAHGGGEAAKLDVEIAFINPYGETTADASGTTYSIPQWNLTYTDPTLIYSPEDWGTYPLYLVGMPMQFAVTLTNTAEHGDKPFNVTVRALSNVLQTDGSAGLPLADQEYIAKNLRPGESRTLYFSVSLDSPDLFKGLAVTDIQILHVNKGAPGAALITERRALWCPPPF